MCGSSCAPPLTGDLACNTGMCPEWELNLQPLGSQASAQSTDWATPARALHSCFLMRIYIKHISLSTFQISILKASSSFFFFLREREEGRDRKTSFCCFSYLCIHWLLLVCALTRVWTHSLGRWGQCSNQLRYPVRAPPHFSFFIFAIILLQTFSIICLNSSPLMDI